MKKLTSLKAMRVFALGLALAIFLAAASAFAQPWSFGVMSDTQWKANLDGDNNTKSNPNSVAVGIINQLNQEFINKGVKFVVQVGDLTDNGSIPAMDTRASAAQALYDAGIGFFPLRGNHESSQAAALRFQTLYPQTIGSGDHVVGATNFSSPQATLNGLSYSFDFDNARFVLLDQFTRTDNTNYLGSSNNNIIDQQGWISSQLSTKPADGHAFVFSHKELIGQNHADGIFGTNPSTNPEAQNAFIDSLATNGVRYALGGHDHMHHRSFIESPDGTAKVQEIITASNSYKFYIPKNPSNDVNYNTPANGMLGPRETPIAQELFTVGYYIFTVDGPRVTVDFYASNNGFGSYDVDLLNTPTLSFSKRESFGYSLNGQEFLVPPGETYTVVQDRFSRTAARILSGTNDSTATAYDGRPLIKAVNTGWTPRKHCRSWAHKTHDALASDVLSLWGMASIPGWDETGMIMKTDLQSDVYTLSMTYDHRRVRPEHLGRGRFGLVTRDADGNWVNAVDKNFGGVKNFVLGKWKPNYPLGTYGVDPRTHTAWAVINHDGDFAVARELKRCPEHRR
jgi:hypothetical protein